MAEFREDTLIYPKIIEMSACLCLEIEASGLRPVCSCGPVVGALSLDYCSSCAEGQCGGQAWVRFVTTFPSIEFPQQQVLASNCTVPVVYQIEVGMARCKPVGTSSGVRGYQPPTLEEQVDALREQMADVAAMYRAINCCFMGNKDGNYNIGQYTPLSPEGDCLGGSFLITVQDV